MNAIQLDKRAALLALDAHLAYLRRVSGPFGPPDWFAQPVAPLCAWERAGKQPADRKQERETTTLYLFQFVTPQPVGSFTLAGYVLAVGGGGSCASHWWQGQDGQEAAERAGR